MLGFRSQAERAADYNAMDLLGDYRSSPTYKNIHGLDMMAEGSMGLYNESVGGANSWTNLRKGANMPWENFNYQNTGINGVPMVVDSSVSTVNQNSHPILTGSTATNIDDTYIWTGGPVGQGI